MSLPDPSLISGADGRPRCWWCASPPEYTAYHDTEWGLPVADDTRLFEKLCLEGFQSGLSWLTILRKRPGFRDAFARFDLETVAGFDEADLARLLGDARIVRHRGKIASTIHNAGRALALRDEFGSLSRYVWRFEPAARPARLTRETLCAMTTAPESVAMSKDLKRRGWTYVGPTTVYAFMQAMGLVNDHLDGCFARPAVASARAAFSCPAAP